MTLQEAADAYASACNEAARALQSKANAQQIFNEAEASAGNAILKCSMAKDQLILVAAGVETPISVAAPKREPRVR
jgi:hypothetical protein